VAARTKVGPNGSIDDAQLATVMEPLLRARAIGLPLPGTYITIADAWLAAATPPKIENFAILGEGFRLFPRATPLLYSMAQLYQRVGERAAAVQVAQFGLRHATDAADRDRFEQLLASLPPASPAAK
jgi:hypothetical protein